MEVDDDELEQPIKMVRIAIDKKKKKGLRYIVLSFYNKPFNKRRL